MKSPIARNAFTLIELLVVIAIIALLVSILMPSLADARKTAKLAIDSSNLKNSGVAMSNYATDFKDLTPAYSANSRQRFPNSTGLPTTFASDVQGAAIQAVDILRRRSKNPTFPIQPNWTPHVLYTHLVILDYLGTRLPEPIMISPNDRVRLQWAQDPTAAAARLATTRGVPTNERWPYSSSYMISPGSYAPDRQGADGTYMSQAGAHNLWFMPSSNVYRFGPQTRSAVAFPSGKVYLHDQQMRYFGKFDAPFLWRGAKVNCLFYDTSVRITTTGDCNLGGYALNSNTWETPNFSYDPASDIGESRWPGDPNASNSLTGRYRWTAYQKKGIDVGSQNPYWNRFPGRTATAPN